MEPWPAAGSASSLGAWERLSPPHDFGIRPICTLQPSSYAPWSRGPLTSASSLPRGPAMPLSAAIRRNFMGLQRLPRTLRPLPAARASSPPTHGIRAGRPPGGPARAQAAELVRARARTASLAQRRRPAVATETHDKVPLLSALRPRRQPRRLGASPRRGGRTLPVSGQRPSSSAAPCPSPRRGAAPCPCSTLSSHSPSNSSPLGQRYVPVRAGARRASVRGAIAHLARAGQKPGSRDICRPGGQSLPCTC